LHKRLSFLGIVRRAHQFYRELASLEPAIASLQLLPRPIGHKLFLELIQFLRVMAQLDLGPSHQGN
jgi:hypothetical protein